MDFSKVYFGVKVCDLQMKKKTFTYAKLLDSKLGDYAEVDKEEILAPSKYVKLWVDLNITKLLKRGKWGWMWMGN